MWFVGVEVEQETSAPPPKKILDPPLFFNTFLLFMTRVDGLAHYLLFTINKNAPTGAPVSLAWRLDGELRRRLIVHETGFTLKVFFSYFIDFDYSPG